MDSKTQRTWTRGLIVCSALALALVPAACGDDSSGGDGGPDTPYTCEDSATPH